MALVYAELESQIARGAFGGLVVISSATALFCMSAVLDALVVSGSYEPLTDAQLENVRTWRATAFAELRDALIGQVITTITTDNPNPGILLPLDGSTHQRADYPILWDRLPAALKTPADFTLPDMADRVPRGGTVGALVGQNSINLTVGQLPPHQHTYQRETGTAIVQGELAPATVSGVTTTPVATQATGAGDPIDVTNASVGMNFWVVAK